LPVPKDADPAYWKPTPEDIRELQQADLVILNGASYESWISNVSLPTSRLVNTSVGFRDRFITLDEVVTHSHGSDGEHEHSATAFTTWLDLTLAVEQARSIADAFSKRWPEHKGQFEAQLNKLLQDLDALDGEIKEIMSGAPRVPVVFSHPVYQYFERRYGTDGRSVHWEPHEMPTDEVWEEFNALLIDHAAKWMIWEGEPSPEIVTKLNGMGVRSVVFDPCAGTPEDGDFVSVMTRNVEALKTVFSE
jgi:zinc transport system substrate-binding protein